MPADDYALVGVEIDVLERHVRAELEGVGATVRREVAGCRHDEAVRRDVLTLLAQVHRAPAAAQVDGDEEGVEALSRALVHQQVRVVVRQVAEVAPLHRWLRAQRRQLAEDGQRRLAAAVSLLRLQVTPARRVKRHAYIVR